jgi:ligand-binding SRPBCC domain-containing protein
MPRIEMSSVIRSRVERVFDFFLDLNNLRKISPTSVEIIEIHAPTPITEGCRFTIKARSGRMRVDWEGRIVRLERPTLIVDEQLRGPFSRFVHTHRFRDMGNYSMMIDEVDYEPRFGVIGRLANALVIRRQMDKIFEYRYERLREIFLDGP